MKAIISIHDVSPCFRKEVEIILRELEGIKKSLLLTPLWNAENVIKEDFAKLVAKEELVLHGLTHKAGKNDYCGKFLLMSSESCKEFYQLNETDSRQKIETAKKVFEEHFQAAPKGFIPPMWHHNKYTIAILKELGFHYTESGSAFINLKEGIQTFSIPACFDFGNNILMNYISVYGWRYFFKHLKQPLFRLSIHPADLRNGFLKDIIEIIKWLQDKNYTFLNYQELTKN